MEKTIIDFAAPDAHEKWETVNDVVMGGLSESSLKITEKNTALFKGTVSMENYGGFSSMRSHPGEFDLSGYLGLIVKVNGDGKDYRLRLRTDDGHDGIAYQAHFVTEKNKWVTVRLPFDTFIPVFRGRVVDDAPDFDVSRVRRIGFMIADKQEGPFRLEIESVKAYA
jgi:hypothetical protein